jgi:putative addiction module CopG family antidote
MNVSLPKHLKHFVTEQVHSGRFGNEAEVIHSALRQMEESEREREMRSFESAFREIDRNSPVGEPKAEDLAEINGIVTAVRDRGIVSPKKLVTKGSKTKFRALLLRPSVNSKVRHLSQCYRMDAHDLIEKVRRANKPIVLTESYIGKLAIDAYMACECALKSIIASSNLDREGKRGLQNDPQVQPSLGSSY